MNYNVLVYPNITFARNLEADSYIVAARSMIRHLNQIRDDLNFTMLLPDEVESLRMPNVRQVIYPLPTYPNTMRCHFAASEFLEAIEWRTRSYDIVWSHLPEHTLAIKNVLYNSTNERPVFVGYSHWFEVPENTAYSETMFDVNIAGIRAMRTCGVNSQWLRELILGHATKRVGGHGGNELNNILTAQYLGTDLTDIEPMEPQRGLIVFNHRANEYTGFKWAVAAFDDLWNRRQDFQVAFTLADVDSVAHPWATRIHANDRQQYLRNLSAAWFGVGTFQRYSAWSVSVMDGLGLGVPYVLPNGLCYPEMVGLDWPLLYDGKREFLNVVNDMLANPDKRQRLSLKAREVASWFAWSERIQPISVMFDDAIAALPVANPTPSYDALRKRAWASRAPTKAALTRDMGWNGPRVPWTAYRNALRRDGLVLADPDDVGRQLTLA